MYQSNNFKKYCKIKHTSAFPGKTKHLRILLYLKYFPLSFKFRFGAIFSNWLLMYLTDQECVALLQKILLWLEDGGWLFFRESCFHSSGKIFEIKLIFLSYLKIAWSQLSLESCSFSKGNMSRQTNPTFYRTPADYASLLEAAWVSSSDSILEPSESGYGFNMVSVGSLRSYIKVGNGTRATSLISSLCNKFVFSI